MLNRSLMKLCLILAIIAVFWGVHISLVNFNKNVGFTPPVQTVSLQQTNDGWQLSLLEHKMFVKKQQLDKFKQVTTKICKKDPIEMCQKTEENIRMIAKQLSNRWQQVFDKNKFDTVRCWVEELDDQK